jgi:hypothetical protein
MAVELVLLAGLALAILAQASFAPRWRVQAQGAAVLLAALIVGGTCLWLLALVAPSA